MFAGRSAYGVDVASILGNIERRALHRNASHQLPVPRKIGPALLLNFPESGVFMDGYLHVLRPAFDSLVNRRAADDKGCRDDAAPEN